ncbi:DNA methyltransferase, partial [Conchiformibius steedae]|uniref:DNA methyltransferase n=1 Tax=Conchiformibius steedae TaxID=153493 RepID=UPI0026EEDFD9
LWLNMMYPRLELLRELLAEDGSIWIMLDDNEIHYLKIICDEVFGRRNFINQISIKMKQTAGASGGGEDKKLKKNIEYILVYAKNNNSSIGFQKFNDVYDEEDLFSVIDDMEANGKSWKYTSILINKGEFVEERIIYDGAGEEISVKKYKNIQRETINSLQRKGTSREMAYSANFENIFSDTNAQTSIRTRIIDEFQSLNEDELLIAEYVPRSGRDKGKVVQHYYISPTIRRVIWLHDTAVQQKNRILKLEKTGTFWGNFPLNNLTKEGNVQFPNGKKPEALLKKIFELATNEGDLVLDSFLGSGTTAAVAHKMNRRYIGIEIGQHAQTHVVPRLQKVIDGEQGGISGSLNWQGGGSFRFCELGESVFDAYGSINPSITFPDLAAHVWYLENRIPFAPQDTPSPLLGLYKGRAYYLLYNGILGDKRPQGGNVLTKKVLAELPNLMEFLSQGVEVTIYGEATRLTDLTEQGIAFKQIPYDISAK